MQGIVLLPKVKGGRGFGLEYANDGRVADATAPAMLQCGSGMYAVESRGEEEGWLLKSDCLAGQGTERMVSLGEERECG